MKPKHTFLQAYRKQSHLTQKDMAYLLGISQAKNLSRYELGHVKPTIEMCLIYHLTFGVSIESLLKRQCEYLRPIVIAKAKDLMRSITSNSRKAKLRRERLNNCITHLSNLV